MSNNEQIKEMISQNIIEEKTILVSDDNGMGANKITYGFGGEFYQFDFPSMYKVLERMTSDSYIIDGEIVTFSEGMLAVENGHPTKDDEFHEMLLKKALYEVYKKTNIKVFDVVTNYSLDSLKKDGGASVLERMSNIKTFKVKELNREEVEITINKIDCYPECISGGALVDLNLREEDVVFTDLGTRNMQHIRVVEGIPKYETCIATTKGMYSLYRGVANITKTLNEGIDDYLAVKMYLTQTNDGKIGRIDTVYEKILDYLMDVTFKEMDKCFEEMETSRFTKHVFLGGGSTMLKYFLDLKFEERTGKKPIYINNPYFATSLGLFRKGEQLYNYPKHKDAIKQEKNKKEAKKTNTKKDTVRKPKTTNKEKTLR